MKKLASSVLLLSLSLWAADFWQSKDYTAWSDKDVRRMLDSSPWSKPVNVSLSAALPGGSTGRKGSGGRGSISEVGNPNPRMPDPMTDATSSGIGQQQRGGQAEMEQAASAPSVVFTVRWESALPVRQARVRAKYGSEVGTSAEAKKILDAPEPTYIITVSGLMSGTLEGGDEAMKKKVMADAALLVKGRLPIRPVDFMLQRGDEASVAVFAFPRTEPLSLDDKEVDFTAKFNSFTVKQRFPLKSMVINGRLEL